MLDPISLAVADYERSRAFYDEVLAVLGHRRIMEITDLPAYVAAGHGASEHEPAFWIGGARESGNPAPQPPDGQHVAFSAAARAMVDAFDYAALRAGTADNGPPGPRALSPELLCLLRDRSGRLSPRGRLPPTQIARRGRRAGGILHPRSETLHTKPDFPRLCCV